MVENNVRKGEIVCYEQFRLFPQCFQNTFTAETDTKHRIVVDRVKQRMPVL